jgi:hypothetical protein
VIPDERLSSSTEPRIEPMICQSKSLPFFETYQVGALVMLDTAGASEILSRIDPPWFNDRIEEGRIILPDQRKERRE